MKRLVVSVVLSSAFMGCKTTNSMDSNLAEGAGAAGGLCPTLDLKREKDPARRARLKAFLIRMWMKGNARAGTLLAADMADMEMETFMREWSKGKAGLLTDASGPITEEKINTTVEKTEMDKASANAREGGNAEVIDVAGKKVAMTWANIQPSMGRDFAQAQQAGKMNSMEVMSELEQIVKDAYQVEGELNNETNERKINRGTRLLALGFAHDNAVQAGVVQDGSMEADKFLFRGVQEAFRELAQEQALKPTEAGVAELEFRAGELERMLRGDKAALEKTGVKDVVARVKEARTNPNATRVREVADRASLERLTNFESGLELYKERNGGQAPKAIEALRGGGASRGTRGK
jgi:hypothetical protein